MIRDLPSGRSLITRVVVGVRVDPCLPPHLRVGNKMGSAGVGLMNEMWRSRSIEKRETETGAERGACCG